MNFAATIARKKDIVYELHFPIMGKNAWYILWVSPLKHEILKRDYEIAYQKKSTISLDDYGEVLHSGWGIGPSDELKLKLHEQFDIYED